MRDRGRLYTKKTLKIFDRILQTQITCSQLFCVDQVSIVSDQEGGGGEERREKGEGKGRREREKGEGKGRREREKGKGEGRRGRGKGRGKGIGGGRGRLQLTASSSPGELETIFTLLCSVAWPGHRRC